MPFSSSLTIRSETRFLEDVRSWIASMASLVGVKRFPERALVPVRIALIEAVDNAIFHAHRGETGQLIQVRLEWHEKDIVIEVVDSGKGFQRSELLQTPVDDEVPDPLRSCGRGLFLMKKLMHEVSSRHEEKYHIIRMVYRCEEEV